MSANQKVFLSRHNETIGDRDDRFNFVFEDYLNYDFFVNSTNLYIIAS